MGDFLTPLRGNTVHSKADAIPIAADPPVAKSGDIPLDKGDKREIPSVIAVLP